MTTLKAIERQYPALGPDERFRLVVAAWARGDTADVDRLVDACPREDWRITQRAYRERIEALRRMVDLAAVKVMELNTRLVAAQASAVWADALWNGIREGYAVGYRAGWRACHVLAGDGGAVPDHAEALAVAVERQDAEDTARVDELADQLTRQAFDLARAAAFCRAFDAWAADATGASGLELVGMFWGDDFGERAARVWSAVEGVDPDPEALADWRAALAELWVNS